MKDEKQLIAEYRQGKESAVEELLEKYKGLVNSIARQYVSKSADREDVVQEGMIGLFRAVVTYDLDGKITFITYAHECVKNRILDYLRKDTRLKNKALSDRVPIGEVEDTDSGMLTPEEIAINTEEADAIKDLIATSLTQLERDIFDMHLKGMSYSQIAQNVGKNVKYIDNTLQKIRRKIKTQLK